MTDTMKMFPPSFFRRRNAQGLSLNVVIIAVIAIAVLVILLVMLIGKTKIFGTATADCISKGGTCTTPNMDGNCPDGRVKMFGAKCKESGKICCTQLEQAEYT